jgi:hypothetical protein
LSQNQQAVQAVHAVLEASRQGIIPSDITHPSLVLCELPDEKALVAHALRLNSKNIKFAVFKEPDINNQITALATEPLSLGGRKAMSSYKLLQLGV